MGSIPSQERHVDPFASYNSDTINKLTQMITRGNDGITSTRDLDVIPDSTSATTHVIVKSGFIFKDDLFIQINEDFRLDFTDSDCYVSFGTGFDEDGWYAIVFDYTYVKSRPAPAALLKILKPSQIPHPSLGTSLLFLKSVYVTGGGPHYIDTSVDFLDYDPGTPSIKREYTDLYFGVEQTLPTHSQDTDVGRVVYESSTDSFWFGYTNRWGKISAGVEVDIDTTGLNVGELCYTDSNGKAAAAIATSLNTGAEMAVAAVGTEVDRSGRTLMSGVVNEVPIETGIVVSTGQILYLSNTEAGHVTTLKPIPLHQVVGRSLTGGNSSNPITMLLFPRDVLAAAITGSIEPSDWVWDAGSGYWIEEFDVSVLELDSTAPTIIINVWDGATNTKISPVDVEMIGSGNAVRVYTNDNSLTWNYIVSSGGTGGGTGGGGSGGTTDHSLLFNLDYASSSHTGFAPSPHNNAHHSATFIEAAGVTFANLNANGDVGTGAAQVSQGDHTHAGLVDVPSGEIVLFESDVQVTGYTLQVDIDDQLIYISSGGAAGQKPLSTWSQPNHGHPTGSHTLTIAEMPSHRHQLVPPLNNIQPGISEFQGGSRISHTSWTQYEGGGASHNHGSTSGNATTSSWRPLGRNFTRQQRN